MQTERYQFLDLLGRGGMGEVYRGRALGFGGFEKVVAIKRLLPAFATDARYVDRLVREAKMLVALQHSNLVSVLDLGRFGADVFIVLEYVDGPSLYALQGAFADAGQAAMPLGLVSYVVQSACAGIDVAHDQPSGAIVHADLSPANVLLSRAGEIKVADFGIARREGTPQRASSVEGKWPYMSPEQVLGDPLTPASDIFSMGIVLYQLATGALPFTGPDPWTVGSAIVEGAYPPLRSRRPDAPRDFVDVVTRALATSPAERFPTMREMGAALRAVSFAHGWRDGADELALAIRTHFPPRLPTDEDVREVLARLGIDDVPRDATTRRMSTGEGTEDMAGTVVLRRALTMRPRRRLVRARRWAAVAAVAAAVMYGVASSEPPAMATLATEAAPTREASAALVAAAPADPPPAVPVPVVEPLVVARDRASSPAPRRRRSAARRRQPGTLRIHADPWAYVRVDGASRRYETPVELELPAGRHTLRFENPAAGATRTRSAVVRPGRVTTLRVQMEAK